MKIIKLICAFICVVIIGIVLSFKVLVISIPLGKVGVLTQQYNILGTKGVQEKDYGPGWHRDWGPLHSWTLYDSTAQTIELTSKSTRGGPAGEGVVLKSSDGYNITMDITLKFKIKKGRAHILYQEVGANESTYKSIVRNVAFDAFREVFGGMKTEDFYNPMIREKNTHDIETRLRKELELHDVELIDVLIRDISFDEQYEQRILLKKLADQDVELNKSQTLAADKKGETQDIEARAVAKVKVIEREREGEILTMRAETDKEIAQIRADSEKYETEKKADANLYAAEQIAKGTLLVKESEAEGERLKAAALQGSGGANVVALESARNILLKNMTISTIETDFLDIDKMVKMLGANAGNP